MFGASGERNPKLGQKLVRVQSATMTQPPVAMRPRKS